MKTIISSLFAAAFVLSASLSMAADPAHVEQLKKTGKCIKCDLRGAFMFGADLITANLRGSNLRGADLRKANLSFANLSFVNLRGANLRGAILDNTKLVRADLVGADLRDAIMVHTNVRGALFCRTRMPNGEINNRNCGYKR